MKALKFIAIAAAPIILIVGIWMFMKSGSNELPDSYYYADIVSGEVMSFQRGTVKSIPIKNKRDGKRTIYPVSRDPAGNYVIDEQFRPAVSAAASSLGPLKVDPQSFVVKQ